MLIFGGFGAFLIGLPLKTSSACWAKLITDSEAAIFAVSR